MIPLELFLKVVCHHSGQFAISQFPDLVILLMGHEQKDKLFHIEKTSAAKGPLVVWYPLSKWKEEQQYSASIDRLLAEQYKPKADPMELLFKRMETVKKLQEQIKEAEEKGLTQIVESLKAVLSNV